MDASINIGNSGFQSMSNGEYIDKSGQIHFIKLLIQNNVFVVLQDAGVLRNLTQQQCILPYFDHSCDFKSPL